MNPLIDIIGIGADGPAGLRPELIERIHAAEFLAGGKRHLEHFPNATGERLAITNDLRGLCVQLGKRWPARRCVVLASGDPLFFGIAAILIGQLGKEKFRVEPALSSMQLAFARAGLPWSYAALDSIHGRPPRPALLPLLGKHRIGLFTHDGDSPALVARFFQQFGLANYAAYVGENLGGKNERFTRWENLDELASQTFSPLNYLILERRHYPVKREDIDRNRALIPGAPDAIFARPTDHREVMTRQEVRAVTLAKLGGEIEPGETIWDIGAGLGTVAVELAVLRPQVEIVAVERDPARAVFLRQNRERFDAYNVRVLEGAAPEVLHAETERPKRIFLGGSGEHLIDILELAQERLRDGGRLVANFVTLEHLTRTLARLKEWGWPFEISEVHVSRSDALAGLTGLKPQRGVFIVSGEKP